jgi:IS66 Orf2 like protein
VDFRKGMNGLAAVVQEQLKADPFSGTIYCFRSKRADRVPRLEPRPCAQSDAAACQSAPNRGSDSLLMKSAAALC